MLFVNNVCKVVVNNLKYNGKTLIFIDFERNKFFNDYGKGYQVSAVAVAVSISKTRNLIAET
ncbi:MAG: hypothetical protein BGP13_13920 [Sphingobacteriales bacterium 40-81]|nr:MAG: hypothetical protein BGP13_13920 [Sphingobacteriales bacterium 40-81]